MNTVGIKIYKDPTDPKPDPSTPRHTVVRRYYGAPSNDHRRTMYEKSFSFRVVYRSIFGAFIDSIDGTDDDPTAGRFWMLSINGEESGVGVSEAIISEDEVITSAVLEWRYVGAAEASHQVTLKTKSLPAI